MNFNPPPIFLAVGAATGVMVVSCARPQARPVTLNDVHSRLNRTTVADYHEPATKAGIIDLIRKAGEKGLAVSLSGARHSMGGQQFGEGTLHINLSRYNRVMAFEERTGRVTVESGIRWPQLHGWLRHRQEAGSTPWGIRQKQTGADHLSVGGSLSSNVHGRGLTLQPIVGDVVSFELILSDGQVVRCSREENRELFGLAIGGYGLFGVIGEVTLQLGPRTKLERKVEVVRTGTVPERIEERIRDGFLYGDYQFITDERSTDFLDIGVLSCYRPVPAATPIRADQKELKSHEWEELYRYAHVDKTKAFQLYSRHYLATDGQIYWSDTHQMSGYIEGQDAAIDRAVNARAAGSLMITELYVPRGDLPRFLRSARDRLRERNANLIYGTVRFIDKDDVTFLPWARESFACVVMNLRVTHDPQGIEAAKLQFQDLIDAALDSGGSYFLTYHRWARHDQVLKAYPQFPEFLRLKRKHDPEERFQSEWYRHYKAMFPE